MKVTVDKKVLNQFLEMIAENYLPGEDDIDKFALEEEPIKAVDLMATQLATEKPDVADPDYQPASIQGLSSAAAVIAEEVPPDMIATFYNGLHRLLDTVYDLHKEKQLQESNVIRRKGAQSQLLDQLINAIRELKKSTIGKVDQLKAAGFDDEDLAEYKSLLSFMFSDPVDELQKTQMARDLVMYAIQNDDDSKAIARQVQSVMGLDQAALVEKAAAVLKDDVTESAVEADDVGGDDYEIVEFVANLFQAIIAGAARDGEVTPEELSDYVSQTLSKLVAAPTVRIEDQDVPSQTVALLLQAELDQYLEGVDTLPLDIEPEAEVELPQPIDDAAEEKRTFSEMAEFLGFSGASGARQWYRKHVENKFLTLLKTMVNLDDAAPGDLRFYNVFSDSYKSILKKMSSLSSEFESLYVFEPGSRHEAAMKSLLSDLSELDALLDPLDHILSSEGDQTAITNVMNSHIGKAVAMANSETMKIATTFIMDKAAPPIIMGIIKNNYPNITDAEAKKLQEHVSGKSNRAFTEKEVKENKYKTASKKFIKLGIDREGYLKIVEEYLEELDEIIENVLLPPEVGKQLFGSKFDEIMKKDPTISQIYKKISKKANLKDNDVLGMMEEALIDYSTDMRPDVPRVNETTMKKYKLLAELINRCL